METKSLTLIIFSLFYTFGLCAFYAQSGLCFALFSGVFLIFALVFNKIKPSICVALYLIFFLGFFNANLQDKNFDGLSEVIRANDVVLKGRVYSIPTINHAKRNVKFYLGVYRADVFDFDIKPRDTKVLVSINYTDEKYKGVKVGDIIEIEGKLRTPYGASNPSEFDYKRYLRNKNTFNILYGEDNCFKVLAHPDMKNAENKLKEFWWISLQRLDLIRSDIISVQGKYVKSPNLEVLGGVVFGDDAVNPPDEVKQSFINSGLLHLLAASGLNVALIFGIWWAVADFLKFPYRFSVVAGMVIIILYTFMTGFPPPVLRASIMLLLVLLGKMMFKRADNLSLMFFTGFIILLFSPKLANDVGFQLSFLVTTGLITCIEPVCKKFSDLDKKFKKKFYKKPKIIRAMVYMISPTALVCMVLVPVTAQLWAAPLQMYYFNTFSIYSVFANIAVVPFIGMVSFIGFLSSVLALVPFIGDFIVKICSYILNPLITIILSISDFFSKLPNATVKVPSPEIFQIIVYYVLILAFIMCLIRNFRKIKANIIFCVVLLIFLLGFVRFPNNNFEIIAFDVQNADSFLIKTPKNKFMLIDTGRLPYKGVSSAKKVVLEYLYDKNIREIENLIVTHFDSDHSGGTIDILENMRVKNIYIQRGGCDTENSCKIINYLKENKIEAKIAKNDEIIYKEDDFEIRTFVADVEGKYSKDRHENENSIITLINYKGDYSLFMADAGKDGFYKIKDKLPRNIKILKAGHHGAKGVVDKNMLEYLKPEYAIISTGFNIYGHPSKETIEMLENSGAKVLSTKDLGALKLVLSEKGIKVFGFLTKEGKGFREIE